MTEEQRRQNTITSIRYITVTVGIILCYLFGYIGSVAGESGEGLAKAIGEMVTLLGEFHVIPPALNLGAIEGVLFAAAISVILYIFLVSDYERNKSYKAEEVAGTGGFMTEKDLQAYNEKAKVKPDPTGPDESSPYMINSQRFRRPINSRDLIGNNNILVVGGAGSGKSRFLIKPNILQLNASYVITDPSGEMLAATGKVLTEHGYKIKIFNISHMVTSNCYNPLNYIRDEAGVNMVIDCFIKNTSDSKAHGGDEFFTNAEKLLYSACIFYLLDFESDVSKKNFSSVVKLVNASQVDENAPDAKSPVDRLFDALPGDSQAYQRYRAFKQAAGKTLKSIIISCLTRLQPFMTPQVANLTKRDELELDKIGDEKTALFIVTPQANHTYSFLSSMMYSQLFETLYFKGEQQKAHGGSEQLKFPVRCLMDEFANGGEIPEFPSRLSTMRKYNISSTVVLQDLAQIESMYDKDWRTLAGNCSTHIFLGSLEKTTKEYYSEMLGKKTITTKSRGMSSGKSKSSTKNFQQTGREVMTAEELGRLNPMTCVVFTQNYRALLDKKYDYVKHPLYEQTGDAHPENAYLYQEMPIYDNSSTMDIESLLKAEMEVTRMRSQEIVTDPLDASELVLGQNIQEEFDNLGLDKAKEQEAFFEIYEDAFAEAVSSTADVVVLSVKGLQTNRMLQLVSTLQINVDKPVIIFSDLTLEEGDVLAGVAEGDDIDLLYDAVDNDYILSAEKEANGTIMLQLNKRNYERFITEVNSRYGQL